MKKILIPLFLFICFLSFNNNIYAKCNDEELLNWANNVNVRLIKYKNSYFDENGKYINTGDLNYSYLLALDPNRDDVYMVSVDKNYGEKLKSEYIPGFNLTAIGSYVTIEETTYTISIYGSKNSACPNELLKKVDYTVPPYNSFSKTEYCDNNPNDSLCSSYKNTSNITEKEFYEYSTKNDKNDNKEKTNYERILEIVEYLLFILVPIVIASIIFNAKLKKYKKEEGDK